MEKYIFKAYRNKQILYSVNDTDFTPERGSEIFVKQIPSDVKIIELTEFFEIIGPIFEVRLIMKNRRLNRGFGYVTYMNSTFANRAIENLKSIPFKNEYLNIEKSLNNCRLFMGNIPRDKTKDEILMELARNDVKNIVDVIVCPSYNWGWNNINKYVNRGFVFVEFKTRREASKFKSECDKAINGEQFRLWNREIIVDWAVPIPEVEENMLQNVSKIYLKNLDVTVTPENLKELLSNFIESDKLEKVFKFKDYAFIHVVTRVDAEDLMKKLKNEFKNTEVQIEWAKPQNKYTSPQYRETKLQNQIKQRINRTKNSMGRT